MHQGEKYENLMNMKIKHAGKSRNKLDHCQIFM